MHQIMWQYLHVKNTLSEMSLVTQELSSGKVASGFDFLEGRTRGGPHSYHYRLQKFRQAPVIIYPKKTVNTSRTHFSLLEYLVI